METRSEEGQLKVLRATSAKVPVMLLALDLGDSPIPAIRIAVETEIDTADLEPGKKLKLYRRLLSYSKLPLAKMYLFGEDHRIALAVDLDKRSLSKNEFNDAVAALLLAYITMVEELGLQEEAAEEALRNLMALAAAQVRLGKEPEEIRKNLEAAGVPKEIVDNIVDAVEADEKAERKARRSGFYM